MTDYCSNVMAIEGSAADLADFRLRFIVDGHFGFEQVLPIPNVVSSLDDSLSSKLGRTGELAVAALLKSEAGRPYPNSDPILEREAVKEAGIRSYEDLEEWLRQNHPKALELGARAVEAYRRTGSCFRDDWCTTNWGTRSYLYSELRNDGDRRIRVTFETAYSPPTALLRALAAQCPRLVIRAVATDTHEMAFLFASERGKIVEEELPWSREALASTGVYSESEIDEIFDEDTNEKKHLQSFADAEQQPKSPEGKQRSFNLVQFISLALLIAITLGFASVIWNALAD